MKTKMKKKVEKKKPCAHESFCWRESSLYVVGFDKYVGTEDPDRKGDPECADCGLPIKEVYTDPEECERKTDELFSILGDYLGGRKNHENHQIVFEEARRLRIRH